MGVIGIVVTVAIGLFLAALAYGINIFEVLLVQPLLMTLLALTLAGILLVIAGRRRR
jgi:hypothetical protein